MYRLLDMPRNIGGVATISGRKIRYNDAASCFSAWRFIFDNHCYRFIARTEAPLILDLGANLGVASLYFYLEYPKARIIAFEPDPELFELLNANLEGLSRIETRRIAISDRDGEVDFFGIGDDSGSLVGGFQEPSHEYRVPCSKLSAVLQEFPRVDFLKMDIEGAEVSAIAEAKFYLHLVDYLFVEFHSFSNQSQSLSKLFAVLEEVGFRYFIQSESIEPSPFVNEHAEGRIDGRVNVYAMNLRVKKAFQRDLHRATE